MPKNKQLSDGFCEVITDRRNRSTGGDERRTMEQGLFQNWAYLLPNFFLAALMYTLLGRFLLSIVFQPESDKTIWVAFKTLTNPFVAATRFITPLAVPERLVVLFSVVWVLLARIALLLAVLAAGHQLSGN